MARRGRYGYGFGATYQKTVSPERVYGRFGVAPKVKYTLV